VSAANERLKNKGKGKGKGMGTGTGMGFLLLATPFCNLNSFKKVV
jgi:hypothetical protein